MESPEQKDPEETGVVQLTAEQERLALMASWIAAGYLQRGYDRPTTAVESVRLARRILHVVTRPDDD